LIISIVLFKNHLLETVSAKNSLQQCIFWREHTLHSYPLGNTRKLPLVIEKTIDGNTNPTTNFKGIFWFTEIFLYPVCAVKGLTQVCIHYGGEHVIFTLDEENFRVSVVADFQ
jgi:hypothetical protein